MKRQNATGLITEESVKNRLIQIGLHVEKPIPDKGVDLLAYDPKNLLNKIKIQVKGRGEIQTNRKYRWFQLRTTVKQREIAVQGGLAVSEAWKKKIELCDFFIFVSLHFNEHWVFPKKIIPEIIATNKTKYGKRADNANGLQVEMDLDIDSKGTPLTEKYIYYLNNYLLIKESFEA